MAGPALNRVLICNTCARAADVGPLQDDIAGVRTALALAGFGDVFEVAEVENLGGCTNPVGIAFQGQGRASYVFAGVDLTTDLADIVAVCRAYLVADKGWIVDARPLGRLRFCLRTRVPVF